MWARETVESLRGTHMRVNTCAFERMRLHTLCNYEHYVSVSITLLKNNFFPIWEREK